MENASAPFGKGLSFTSHVAYPLIMLLTDIWMVSITVSETFVNLQ